MDNSLVTHLRAYYSALFLDIAPWYSNKREMDRDLSRLLLNLDARGSRVVTMDIAAIAKHLERGLADGCLHDADHFLSEVRPGTKIPKFLGNLFEQLFDASGMLRSSPDAGIVFAIRQVTISSKKMRLTCAPEFVYAEVRNWFSIEEELESPSLPWGAVDLELDGFVHHNIVDDYDGTRLSEHGRKAVSRLQIISDVVSSQFGDFSDEKPDELPRHGPGVVSNVRRGESKYSFPEWPQKLDAVFPRDDYVWDGYDRPSVHHVQGMPGWEQESPSKLISVPKTQKGPRLIAAEPVQNQWIQQLLWKQLEQRLRSSSISPSIDFRSQEKNRRRALAGSTDGTFCTIDLSSASDRLSCKLIERLFRSNHSLLNRLNACRTTTLVNSIDSKSPNQVVMKKFATQGSACIFPVQSIAYCLIAISACHTDTRVSPESIRKAATSVQVFGDDIIVPNDKFELMCELLAHLGLKVNKNKSFHTGLFRESCGMDAFAGVCVTPAYLLNPDASGSLGSVVSDLAVINNHFKKGLWHASDYLRSRLRRYDRFIPIVSADRHEHHPLSLLSFSGSKDSHLRKRWNRSFHREEFEVLAPVVTRDEFETDGAFQLMKFLHEPSDQRVTFKSDGVRDPINRSLKTSGRGRANARPGWRPLFLHPSKAEQEIFYNYFQK